MTDVEICSAPWRIAEEPYLCSRAHKHNEVIELVTRTPISSASLGGPVVVPGDSTRTEHLG